MSMQRAAAAARVAAASVSRRAATTASTKTASAGAGFAGSAFVPPPAGQSLWSVHSRTGAPQVRWSRAWLVDKAIVCTVFAITGSSSMMITRPLLRDVFGIDGSLKDGPWDFRLAYAIAVMPAYSLTLVTMGALFGRFGFFKHFAMKMWQRMLPLHKLKR